MVRRSSTENFERIERLHDRIQLHQADLLDQLSIVTIIQDIRPHEVYNFAAQSFVPTSWSQPLLTGEFTALGVTRMLEAVRLVDPSIRFYQASSSEMFGNVHAGAAERADALLAAQPLRRGQGLRPLDHRELPRELRHLRLLGHLVQPRVAAAGKGVRQPQGDRRRGADQARPSDRSSSWATSTPCAIGASPATMSKPPG